MNKKRVKLYSLKSFSLNAALAGRYFGNRIWHPIKATDEDEEGRFSALPDVTNKEIRGRSV